MLIEPNADLIKINRKFIPAHVSNVHQYFSCGNQGKDGKILEGMVDALNKLLKNAKYISQATCQASQHSDTSEQRFLIHSFSYSTDNIELKIQHIRIVL